jgi:hypothetical protein
VGSVVNTRSHGEDRVGTHFNRTSNTDEIKKLSSVDYRKN